MLGFAEASAKIKGEKGKNESNTCKYTSTEAFSAPT